MLPQKVVSVKTNIDSIQITDDNITGRGGLAFIVAFLDKIGIIEVLTQKFSFLKKNKKGSPLSTIFKQIICFFFDGTSYNMTRFDHLKKDPAHNALLGVKQKHLSSSHSIKRFFQAFTPIRVWLFRGVIQKLFLQQLKIEKPSTIKIGVDTMVLDNDDALKREGVQPTYKKVKGFQPLQFYWGRYIIDAIFRVGSAHSNHGHHVTRSLGNLVKLIRENYSKNVPIVFLADTGFYDEKIFKFCDKHNIGFIIGGKMYKALTGKIESMPDNAFKQYKKGSRSWLYCDFMDKRGTWKNERRCIYANPIIDEDGQFLFDYSKPENIIYTNLGMENEVTKRLLALSKTDETEISPQAIINSYHMRARDELINRALKNFGTEHHPFKGFTSNAAFYYLMILSFFLFEIFKAENHDEGISKTWYASTFRRRFLDIAGKIVRTGGKLILKVTRVVEAELGLIALWEKIPKLLI